MNIKKKSIIGISIVWTIIILLSLYKNYNDLTKDHKDILKSSANSYFKQLVLVREWNFLHQNVYVPVTKNTKPNIYLIDKHRDISVNKSLELTQIDAAYMTKELSDLSYDKDGIKFRITSLSPIKEDNSPTSMEKIALESFENGKREFHKFYEVNNKEYFFYMAPLITEKRCLSCHVEQGFSVGDIRGGISITIPNISSDSLMFIIITHIIIWLAGILGIIYFTIKLLKAYKELENQAVMDALTGIPNRRSFTEKIEIEAKLHTRKKYDLSIIMCDIDNFKKYNDTYGHSAGDECLKKVANAINKSVRRPSDFCARYGGEEFIIVLPDTNNSGAKIVAQMICDSVRALDIAHDKNLPSKIVTISLGIATRSGEEIEIFDNGAELIKNADEALYMAKESGRDRFVSFN